MDLDFLKNKLADLNGTNKQSTKKTYEKIDYTKYFWRPEIGKHQIRIVPLKDNPKVPFIERLLHYGFTNYPLYSPSSWGKPDPILEMAAALRKESYKDHKELINKLTPKLRVFVPVIVRGEEDKGVRYWEFGKNIYKNLVEYMIDEDYGDFCDIKEGYDFTVEVVLSTVGGKDNQKSTSIKPKPKKSVLSNKAEDIEKWLTIQPNLADLNQEKSYEEVKEILGKFLNPPTTTEPVTTTVQKPAVITTNATAFDSLFAGPSAPPSSDGLPF